MTKDLKRTARFKKDYKREKKTQADLEELLRPVTELLSEGKVLPEKFNDHPLTGEWKDHRDCHIKPDLVLIYRVDDDTIRLARIGSHSELF